MQYNHKVQQGQATGRPGTFWSLSLLVYLYQSVINLGIIGPKIEKTHQYKHTRQTHSLTSHPFNDLETEPAEYLKK